ncbi:MAG TPA: Tm-1-like ATP-binding domain-containing protein [Gemmatales bacterium]|nr:Tm-1-like ATP-binding domain-containing protein [Gemmatales bacterium]
MSLNRTIAVSIDPTVEVGTLAAVDSLRRGGWRTQLFVTGSRQATAFEHAILHDPSIQAVLDFSLGDLAGIRLGIHTESNPMRLTSASTLGLPQVIIPGSLDHVVVHRTYEPSDTRKTLKIDDISTLVRTSPEDNDAFGKELAFKASASKGPVTFVFPRGGLSHWDGEGQLLDDQQANQALLDSLHLWKAPHVLLIESHRHINDPLFAQIVVDQMLKLLVVRR